MLYLILSMLPALFPLIPNCSPSPPLFCSISDHSIYTCILHQSITLKGHNFKATASRSSFILVMTTASCQNSKGEPLNIYASRRVFMTPSRWLVVSATHPELQSLMLGEVMSKKTNVLHLATVKLLTVLCRCQILMKQQVKKKNLNSTHVSCYVLFDDSKLHGPLQPDCTTNFFRLMLCLSPTSSSSLFNLNYIQQLISFILSRYSNHLKWSLTRVLILLSISSLVISSAQNGTFLFFFFKFYTTGSSCLSQF